MLASGPEWSGSRRARRDLLRLHRLSISFLTIALLIILMALSFGILELLIAQNLRRQRRVVDGWMLGLAVAASFGFALAFSDLGFRWIKIGPGHTQTFFGLVPISLLVQSAYWGWPCVCTATAFPNLARRKPYHL